MAAIRRLIGLSRYDVDLRGYDSIAGDFIVLPSFAGEVSPFYGDGGVMNLMNHDPSVRDYADTFPASLGR
jgi:hypothetical protein